MNKKLVGLLGCAAAIFAVAGCTPEARQDVGDAGNKMGDAADKSAKGTAEAVDTAAAKTGEAVKDAAVATKDAAKGAANATEKAAVKTGAAVTDATKGAVNATEKGVAKTADAASKAGDTLSLTPKVKNAILKDDAVDSKNIDVDTVAASKTVTLTGTVPNADMKKKAEADAKTALTDAKSDYKLVNSLTIGAAKP